MRSTTLFGILLIQTVFATVGYSEAVPTGIKRVLVYDHSITGGNIDARKYLRSAVTRLSEQHGFEVAVISEKSDFSYSDFMTYSLVVLSNGDGGVFATERAKEDFERYVHDGGGVIAVHAAGVFATEFSFLSEAMGARVGARTIRDGARAKVFSEQQGLSTGEKELIFNSLPSEIFLHDHWLTFQSNPRSVEGVKVLFSLDEDSFEGGYKMKDHPLVWTRDVGKGKVIYNSMGGSDVYTQADGFGDQLMWNLMKYATASEPVSVHPSDQMAGALQMRLLGRNMTLVFPEGPHILSVWDAHGKLLQRRTFQGPGEFQTPLRKGSGMVTVRVQGPNNTLQKRIVVAE